MIVVAEWNKLLRINWFTFAKDKKDYEQKSGENGHLIYDIYEVVQLPETYAKNIESILAELPNNGDSARVRDYLAAVFYFGLQYGRNEKKLLKARLDELTIVAGRARWQGTEDLLVEIDALKKRLAELG